MQKLEKKLKEALLDQEKKKVRYDTHVLITEGQRRQLSAIIEQNQKFMDDLINAGKEVERIKTLLDEEIKNKDDEQEKISGAE